MLQFGLQLTVKCEQHELVFTLKDGISSTLHITDQDGEALLHVELTPSNDMLITADNSSTFSIHDKAALESPRVEKVLRDLGSRHFFDAARAIHDNLKLPAWKSKSTMMLYNLAMATSSSLDSVEEKRVKRMTSRRIVDEDIYDYHGSNPTKQCKKNGWHYTDLGALLVENCEGMLYKIGSSVKVCT